MFYVAAPGGEGNRPCANTFFVYTIVLLHKTITFSNPYFDNGPRFDAFTDLMMERAQYRHNSVDLRDRFPPNRKYGDDDLTISNDPTKAEFEKVRFCILQQQLR